MGRFLLLAVMAAAVGGSVLAVGTRTTLNVSADRAGERQADVLAREIAVAGQSAAVSAMMHGDGFRDPTRSLGEAQEYEGGQFRIEYTPGATDQQATVRVSGAYGGAMHTIESSYAYEPMDAPGPLWLDVPYVTAAVSSDADIKGGKDDKPVVFDRRKHDELELEGLVPLASLNADLARPVSRAGGRTAVPEASDWTAAGGLLDHLNVNDANGLYAKAVGALDVSRGDVHLVGDQVITGRHRFTSRDGDGIAFIDGHLTVDAHVKGEGVLVVNGGLVVTEDAKLDWEGLVIVHADEDVLPLELEGKVKIKGMLVVDHQAFAPGGHLDVSVYRAVAGMTPDRPQGDLSQQVRPWNRSLPFHQHTHAFDITPDAAPRGDHVYFLEGGRAGRHEHEAQFKSLLDQIGDERVFIEIANADNHGFSRFQLDVAGDDGTGGPLLGTLQGGFGLFAQADAPLRTQAFAASDLRALDIDVQSLRDLRKSFDDATCSMWPICIGRSWDRAGAMALRLRRASDGARLYEASFYWHMRRDEAEEHEAEEAAWRERIRSGEAFGTRLEIGEDVQLEFDIKPIDALSERLDFDGDNVRLVASRSTHIPAAEGVDPGPVVTSGSGGKSGSGGSGGSITVCLAGAEISIPSGSLGLYLAIGAVEGGCPELSPVCHQGRSETYFTRYVTPSQMATHLRHGDRAGTCRYGGSGSGGRGD